MSGVWSLRFPGEDPVEFSDESGIFLRGFPELQQYDITDQDVSMSGVDGIQFGSDTHGGATYAIEFGVDGTTPDQARDREGTLKRLWRGDGVRRDPDAVAELVSDRGRSSFGRPRRIATSASRYFDSPPASDVQAEWRAADPLWYGARKLATVGLVPVIVGGLRAPLQAPLTVGNAPGSRRTEFVVDSEAATPWQLSVDGPILNPTVLIIGQGRTLRYAWQTTIADGDAIDLFTVPWNAGGVRRSSGGTLNPSAGSSRLDTSALTSGTYELVLTGTAPAGNPRATLEWRDAHTTP